MSRARYASLALFVAVGCGTAPVVTPDDAYVPPTDAGADAPIGQDGGLASLTIGGARPARLVAPEHPTAEPAPLLVLLHGYGASGAIQDAYLGVTRAAATRNLWVILPDGTTDTNGMRYWNAPGCCDFAPTHVDDIAYLMGLVHEAIAARPIDPHRVYFFGHSNGGFMSYDLACHAADEIAAIAVLAGSDATDTTDCTPSMPVSVLHLHGTADATIAYGGGNVGLGAFPGAVAITQHWAMRGGCGATPTTGAAIDLESALAGAETTPTIYGGCMTGIDVRLDTIAGGGHIPSFNAGVIGPEVLDWLLTHHR